MISLVYFIICDLIEVYFEKGLVLLKRLFVFNLFLVWVVGGFIVGSNLRVFKIFNLLGFVLFCFNFVF